MDLNGKTIMYFITFIIKNNYEVCFHLYQKIIMNDSIIKLGLNESIAYNIYYTLFIGLW